MCRIDGCEGVFELMNTIPMISVILVETAVRWAEMVGG